MSKMNLPEFDPDEKVEIKEEELQKMNDQQKKAEELSKQKRMKDKVDFEEKIKRAGEAVKVKKGSKKYFRAVARAIGRWLIIPKQIER